MIKSSRTRRCRNETEEAEKEKTELAETILGSSRHSQYGYSSAYVLKEVGGRGRVVTDPPLLF